MQQLYKSKYRRDIAVQHLSRKLAIDYKTSYYWGVIKFIIKYQT